MIFSFFVAVIVTPWLMVKIAGRVASEGQGQAKHHGGWLGRAYAAVARRLYPDRPVEAALVWTDGPKLMAVPQALMDAALSQAR